MSGTEPTKRAAAFMAANAQSPVVFGEAVALGDMGTRYKLEDGSEYKLTLEDCRSMPVPRWLHDVR